MFNNTKASQGSLAGVTNPMAVGPNTVTEEKDSLNTEKVLDETLAEVLVKYPAFLTLFSEIFLIDKTPSTKEQINAILSTCKKEESYQKFAPKKAELFAKIIFDFYRKDSKAVSHVFPIRWSNFDGMTQDAMVKQLADDLTYHFRKSIEALNKLSTQQVSDTYIQKKFAGIEGIDKMSLESLRQLLHPKDDKSSPINVRLPVKISSDLSEISDLKISLNKANLKEKKIYALVIQLKEKATQCVCEELPLFIRYTGKPGFIDCRKTAVYAGFQSKDGVMVGVSATRFMHYANIAEQPFILIDRRSDYSITCNNPDFIVSYQLFEMLPGQQWKLVNQPDSVSEHFRSGKALVTESSRVSLPTLSPSEPQAQRGSNPLQPK